MLTMMLKWSDKMSIDIEQLRRFLVKAKKATYASGEGELSPDQTQRPGFKEYAFEEGGWEYRDSYSGYFKAPGQEVVSFEGKPVWQMSYGGAGQEEEFYDISKETFSFLKKCLSEIPTDKPFRGPEKIKDGDWEYTNRVEGTIEDFSGYEEIRHRGIKVFSQNYFGGLIIHKDDVK